MSERIAIAGAGSIGVAFAIVFARAGFDVALWDPDPARVAAAPRELRDRLNGLAAYALLDEEPAAVSRRVITTEDFDGALAEVALVQECAPERQDVKQELFASILATAPSAALVASSSSAIPVSQVATELEGRERCFVAHPGNPPYLLPVIELVGAVFTAPEVLERARALYTAAGLRPVTLAKEIEGFVFNRLQGALLREAYCLVRDGVIGVDELDTVVRDGLGRRWSFMGPFETADLNTRGGIAAHAAKLGPAYRRMGLERGQDDPWTEDLVADVARQRAAAQGDQSWEDRIAWRDDQLMRLALLKRDQRS